MPRVYRSPKDNEAIREAFAEYITDWKPRLDLEGWEITLHTAAESETIHGSGDPEAGATTKVSPDYLRATICIYLVPDTEWAAEELESTAVHELLHIILYRVTSFADEHKKESMLCKQYHYAEEEVCTRLERIIYCAGVALKDAERSKRGSRQPARAAGQRRSGGS